MQGQLILNFGEGINCQIRKVAVSDRSSFLWGRFSVQCENVMVPVDGACRVRPIPVPSAYPPRASVTSAKSTRSYLRTLHPDVLKLEPHDIKFPNILWD